MNNAAAGTERRCTEIAGGPEGKETAILEEAQTTQNKASEMMSTYLDEDANALDGFEFLTMAEERRIVRRPGQDLEHRPVTHLTGLKSWQCGRYRSKRVTSRASPRLP